jgi:hypothetical protein
MSHDSNQKEEKFDDADASNRSKILFEAIQEAKVKLQAKFETCNPAMKDVCEKMQIAARNLQDAENALTELISPKTKNEPVLEETPEPADETASAQGSQGKKKFCIPVSRGVLCLEIEDDCQDMENKKGLF